MLLFLLKTLLDIHPWRKTAFLGGLAWRLQLPEVVNDSFFKNFKGNLVISNNMHAYNGFRFLTKLNTWVYLFNSFQSVINHSKKTFEEWKNEAKVNRHSIECL